MTRSIPTFVGAGVIVRRGGDVLDCWMVLEKSFQAGDFNSRFSHIEDFRGSHFTREKNEFVEDEYLVVAGYYGLNVHDSRDLGEAETNLWGLITDIRLGVRVVQFESISAHNVV